TSSAAVDTTNSTAITSYNVQKHTKYMSDIMREMESLESYGYKFSVIPAYDSDGSLTSVPCSWQPVTQTVNTQVQIIEGTPRLISATFTDSIEKVVEHVVVYGTSGTPQKSGSSVDGSPSYNTRYHIEVDSTLASASLCDDLSAAIRSRFGSNLISGNIRIHGTPHIDIGDLVYVKIPSIELNGATIDGNYRVKSLDHSVTTKGWFTDLEVGELIESPASMLAGFHAANRLTDAQFID
ncbi:hypothetical protein GQ473_00935, partial [archaeon]|nr:hypothetical protein [archaeon]